MISVIIPVAASPLPETAGTPFVERLNEARADREVLLTVAAPAGEAAMELARNLKARVLEGPIPRGQRLRAAAREARGEILLFLHADTLLPPGWANLIEEAIATGAAGGAFRLGFDGTERSLAIVAFWANLRTALTRVPYGDQAPFVRRDLYEKLGGHAPWPLLEEVDFGKRLKSAGRIAILDARVATSGRRYRERGVLRNVLGNWKVLLRYHLGDSPEKLALLYRKKSGT